jgi:DNA-binding CsgD family transcriptional regulator
MADHEVYRETLRKARQALGSALTHVAKERGAAMAAAAAADYALLVLGEEAGEPAVAPSLPHLSTSERELLTLVAQGRANSLIAAQLSVSIPAVRTRLDRILAKTGSRHRADLTRLALQADLV